MKQYYKENYRSVYNNREDRKDKKREEEGGAKLQEDRASGLRLIKIEREREKGEGEGG